MPKRWCDVGRDEILRAIVNRANPMFAIAEADVQAHRLF
jgi:hypothetical protein